MNGKMPQAKSVSICLYDLMENHNKCLGEAMTKLSELSGVRIVYSNVRSDDVNPDRMIGTFTIFSDDL